MRQVVWRWGLVVNEAMVTRRLRGVESISMDLETVRLPGEDLFYREELERWGVVVQSLRQRRLHLFVLFKSLRYPCRRRHGVLERRLVQSGHSVRNLCITQVQQRGPGRSLGLILYVPLEEVTACLKISYCAAEIFLLSPSASSSSESALLESMSNAALKLSGDSSRAVDSTDEDLERGERDLESLDSLWLLNLLTGVLGGLTGVLACLSASLARLTRELMELWGVWWNLETWVLLEIQPAWLTSCWLSHVREQVKMTGQPDWWSYLEH